MTGPSTPPALSLLEQWAPGKLQDAPSQRASKFEADIWANEACTS